MTRFILAITASVLCTAALAAGPLDKPASLKRHSGFGERRESKQTVHPDTAKVRAAAGELRKLHGLDRYQAAGLATLAAADSATAWQQIAPAPMAYVPWTLSGLRGIAEVRTPQTPDEASNQHIELEHFRTLGYTTALAVWRGEPPAALAALIRELRTAGWRILITYGPAESAETTAYLDPEQMRQAFALLLPDTDALLVTWRKTSPGHWSGGEATLAAWCDRVADIARRIRPDIPVIGELFFVTADRTVIGWAPPAVSAVLVANAGCNGLVPGGVLTICRQRTAAPLLALILGPAPYYNTFLRRDTTAAAIRATCARLENRYVAAGFAGTITLAGDGSGDRLWLGRNYSDSLTCTQWSQQKAEGNPK